MTENLNHADDCPKPDWSPDEELHGLIEPDRSQHAAWQEATQYVDLLPQLEDPRGARADRRHRRGRSSPRRQLRLRTRTLVLEPRARPQVRTRPHHVQRPRRRMRGLHIPAGSNGRTGSQLLQEPREVPHRVPELRHPRLRHPAFDQAPPGRQGQCQVNRPPRQRRLDRRLRALLPNLPETGNSAAQQLDPQGRIHLSSSRQEQPRICGGGV